MLGSGPPPAGRWAALARGPPCWGRSEHIGCLEGNPPGPGPTGAVTRLQQTDFCSWAVVRCCLFRTKGEAAVEGRPWVLPLQEPAAPAGGAGAQACFRETEFRALCKHVSCTERCSNTEPLAQPAARHAQGETRVRGLVGGPPPLLFSWGLRMGLHGVHPRAWEKPGASLGTAVVLQGLLPARLGWRLRSEGPSAALL